MSNKEKKESVKKSNNTKVNSKPKVNKDKALDKEQLNKELYDKKIKELDAKFEALEKRMSKDVYKNQGYEDGVNIDISGKMFASILNSHTSTKINIRRVQEILGAAYEILEQFLELEAELVAELMEIHLDNVDKGLTKEMK